MNYSALDPGIREKVRAIRLLGYETTDSGDGVSKPAEFAGVLPFPHVVVKLEGQVTASRAGMLVVSVEHLQSYVREHFGPKWVAELSWIPGEPAIVVLRGPEVPR